MLRGFRQFVSLTNRNGTKARLIARVTLIEKCRRGRLVSWDGMQRCLASLRNGRVRSASKPLNRIGRKSEANSSNAAPIKDGPTQLVLPAGSCPLRPKPHVCQVPTVLEPVIAKWFEQALRVMRCEIKRQAHGLHSDGSAIRGQLPRPSAKATGLHSVENTLIRT